MRYCAAMTGEGVELTFCRDISGTADACPKEKTRLLAGSQSGAAVKTESGLWERLESACRARHMNWLGPECTVCFMANDESAG